MEVVYLAAIPKPSKGMEKCMDAFISGGWLLIKTESPLIGKTCGRITLGWPENNGKAVLPRKFKNIKVVKI